MSDCLLTPAQRRLLLRFRRAWPEFIPVGRVSPRTVGVLKARGLVDDDWLLTERGLALAEELRRD